MIFLDMILWLVTLTVSRYPPPPPPPPPFLMHHMNKETPMNELNQKSGLFWTTRATFLYYLVLFPHLITPDLHKPVLYMY